MKRRLAGRGAVLQDDTVETAIIGLAHGGRNAHIGSHAGNDQVLDPFVPEKEFKISVCKCAATRFVDDRLSWDRVELVNDIVPYFPTDQETAERSLGTDSKARGIVSGAIRLPTGKS